jgi:ribosomal protein S12 methylthiotransferase accessory factor
VPAEQLLQRPLRWVEGVDLISSEPRFVPLEVVALRRYPGAAFASHTIGLASGNHLLEAIVHGLCERIERDAHVRWSLSEGLRRVDLAGLEDPRGRAVLARLDELGAQVGVFAQTSEIGVPAYHCTLLCPSGPRQPFPAWTWGCGCHLDPTVALLRALGEAIQIRAVYLSGRRDDIGREDYAATMDPREIDLRSAELAATPCSERFVPGPLPAGTLQADLRALVSAVRAVGVREVVVVDMTDPSLGVPVVRVLTPGLEGHPFYDAPGVRTAVPT